MPGSPRNEKYRLYQRGYRPPLQHREIHAGRDDSPRRPGYGEGSIRRLRQLPHDPIEEHLPWPLLHLRRTDTERGLPRRQHLLLPALPARKISNTFKLTIWQYVIWSPRESFFPGKGTCSYQIREKISAINCIIVLCLNIPFHSSEINSSYLIFMQEKGAFHTDASPISIGCVPNSYRMYRLTHTVALPNTGFRVT